MADEKQNPKQQSGQQQQQQKQHGQQEERKPGQSQQGGMFQPVYLRLERLVQLLAAVTVDIGPHGSHPVQVALAIAVNRPAA